MKTDLTTKLTKGTKEDKPKEKAVSVIQDRSFAVLGELVALGGSTCSCSLED
jgi:hypothetical protein